MHKINTHINGFVPAEDLNPPEARPGLAILETPHLSAIAVAASTELPSQTHEVDSDLFERVGNYFDRHLTTISGNPAKGTPSIENYRGVFSETAIKLFGDNVLELTQGFDSGSEYNPFLYELGGMLASLKHNAGVYYTNDDVEGLFGVVAEAVFGDEATKEELSHKPPRLRQWMDKKIQSVSSLDHEIALPLVQDASGMWKVVDALEYSQSKDFNPLEVLRQDNTDKMGWNKYRFRNPTYTRKHDELSTKPVGDGWFTSEWYKDPNYWSAQMRNVLFDTAHDIGERLSGSNTKILFSTEGGIFKGTGAPNTDLDTGCSIICDSPAEFEDAYQAVVQSLASKEKDIPFPTKKGGLSEMLSPMRFYDRSTGQRFARADGEYRWPEQHQIIDDHIIKSVRRNEQGLLITTPDQTVLFKKPKARDRQETFVAISISSGEVQQLANDPRPKPMPKNYSGGADDILW